MLTYKQKSRLNNWFTAIDENTIELKEKRLGGARIMFILAFVIIILINVLGNPARREFIVKSLTFSFMPETRFENEWLFFRDYKNSDYDLIGRTKKEFKAAMWKRHKHSVWLGYIYITPIVLLLTFCLIPSKRRVRFDRKRGIIYTYYKGKLHVTEINKLMRPLSEYMRLNATGLYMWIHPYIPPTGKEKFSPLHGFIGFSDASMWSCLLTQNFKNSGAFYMQKVVVEFMNPATSPERIAELMGAISAKPFPLSFLTTWVGTGLYCKRLPPQAFLESELDKYFTNIASTIKALPSWHLSNKLITIVSAQENKSAGFTSVPCENLFEIPDDSIHKDSHLSLEPYRQRYYEVSGKFKK